MGDINKVEIKLAKSQRIDDTSSGGGQMTSQEIISGQLNELFDDISRLDRVYGRVSIRKAFMEVSTNNREVYYGSHAVLTKNAEDPNVSVCFFSSKDWFDKRDSAKSRIEAYLVKGPSLQLTLWGNHYIGTSSLQCLTNIGWSIPEVGDVIVLNNGSFDQYVRVIDVEAEERTFNFEGSNVTDTYNLQVVKFKLGSQLDKDYIGEEANRVLSPSTNDTKIFNTVAADASRYYGVSRLIEDAETNDLQIRVDTILTNLVPSAASETAITDAGVGVSVSPMIQTNMNGSVSRSLSYSINNGSKIFIGEGISPGTFSWNGGIALTDDGFGNIKSGSTIIGAITYATGIITFGNVGSSYSGTGTATYLPACSSRQISQTGAIEVETNNRGFTYTFTCNPIPKPGSLKVEYLSGGKWYSLWDLGSGKLGGISGFEVGNGNLNFTTGTASVTLKAMPDVGSKVVFFWAKPSEYFDFSGETLPLKYKFNTNHQGIARNTFEMAWAGGNCIVDNGYAGLVVGKFTDGVGWEPVVPHIIVGSIKYATGEISTFIGESQTKPLANETFVIKYNYGDPLVETFFAPPRDGLGRINITLSNTPIIPNTFKIEWHTLITEYEPETRFDPLRDPTYIFKDNGAGLFEGDVNDGTTNWMQGTINTATGAVKFHPDRTTVFPQMRYDWVETAWLHPGVEESRVFTEIQYLPTASIFPTDGSVIVSYCTIDGTNSAEYSVNINPTYFIKADSGLEIVPGGLHIFDGTRHLIDGGDGKLYTSGDGVAGTRLQVGTINYTEKFFKIISDSITTNSLLITKCVGTSAIDPVMSMVFRAPGAPIRPGSAQIRATTGSGLSIEGTTDFSGTISGDGITGHVNFNTGLCHVVFGKWVLDNVVVQSEDWYENAPKSGGNVWKPYIVRASTVSMNAVITSYLPLDPVLLGLDPVRLPLDGKVPIFRDGYIVLIHHTLKQNLPSPIVAGSTYSMSRGDVDLIELYDSTGLYYPEISGASINYTYDLSAGTVTIGNSPNIVGFTQPFYAIHRIEDMCLASDVQITGHISITTPLTHNYPMTDTLVSSVLPSADLQSRAYNEFIQGTWTGVWSDNIIGAPPLANYDLVNYPITVYNKGAIKERWLIRFTTTTTIDVVGEHLGVLATGLSITSLPGNMLEIVNRLTNEKYFSMNAEGFGTGWAAGNCIRFNTDAANFPYWFVRTTLQAPPTEPTDSYEFQIRGDSA